MKYIDEDGETIDPYIATRVLKECIEHIEQVTKDVFKDIKKERRHEKAVLKNIENN